MTGGGEGCVGVYLCFWSFYLDFASLCVCALCGIPSTASVVVCISFWIISLARLAVIWDSCFFTFVIRS